MNELTEMDEEQTKDPDELLDWLCWVWATTAEGFYPPDETARECMESLYPDKSEYPHEEYGVEKGQHSRALNDAVERFNDLERHGYDPKARAEREIQRGRERGLDLPEIDWEWYEESRLGGNDE